MKEIKLPSGAILKISNTPFAISKALYQAVLEEMKGLSLTAGTDMNEVLKNLFCIGFSSKKIETALSECLKRCTYNDGKGDLKIDDSTFEAPSAREDYTILCVEVMMENISPFMKGLSVGLKRVSTTIIDVQT